MLCEIGILNCQFNSFSINFLNTWINCSPIPVISQFQKNKSYIKHPINVIRHPHIWYLANLQLSRESAFNFTQYSIIYYLRSDRQSSIKKPFKLQFSCVVNFTIHFLTKLIYFLLMASKIKRFLEFYFSTLLTSVFVLLVEYFRHKNISAMK